MQLRYPVSMLKRDYEGQKSCSVARVLEIIGERWTWLIIRDAFLGLTKFDEFQESLGIARNVLTDRLNRLVDEGIFERVLYNERPARYEYRLTEKGSDLFTALNSQDPHSSGSPRQRRVPATTSCRCGTRSCRRHDGRRACRTACSRSDPCRR